MQLKENLVDLIESFPNVVRLIDFFREWNQLSDHHCGKINRTMVDGLDSQLDNLEATIISLNTKMAVLCSARDNEVILQFDILLHSQCYLY